MYEEVTIEREVGAIQIPDGHRTVIAKGTKVLITQQLGSSYTVMTDRGAMYRIDDRNADALGKEVPADLDAPGDSDEAPDAADLEERIWSSMRQCYDPEIPVNIVDLGLIYRCEVKSLGNGQRHVEVDMTLTAPGCGMGEILVQDAQEKIGVIPTVVDVRVQLVFDPPWNQSMMSEEARLQTGLM